MGTVKDDGNACTRIKLLRREYLKLSQEAFAQKINISRSNLGNIETGSVNLTERVLSDICQTFSTNEQWILFGKEPVFLELTISEKAYMQFGNVMEGSNEDKKIFIRTILEIIDNVPDESWNYIVDTYAKCKEMSKKEKNS